MQVKDSLPVNATFKLVEGTLERSLGSVEAGRTAEFRYVIIPTGGQRSIACPAAEVTYVSAAGLPQSHLLSTTQDLDILSKAQHFEQILVNVVCFPAGLTCYLTGGACTMPTTSCHCQLP